MLEKNNNCKCNCKCGKTPASQTKAESLQTHRELFEEFYSGVTLHGFRFLFEGKWIRRLIWFTICSCVFAFSFYLAYDLMSDYWNLTTSTGRRHCQQKIGDDKVIQTALEEWSRPSRLWAREIARALEQSLYGNEK